MWIFERFDMLDSLAEQLLEKIREDQQDRRRLFIDGIDGFGATSVDPRAAVAIKSTYVNT